MHQIASAWETELLNLHDLFVKCPGVEESIKILKHCIAIESSRDTFSKQ